MTRFVVSMASRGYLKAMDGVRIAELKKQLGVYLRRVRRGSSLAVLDGDLPIARLIPDDEDRGEFKVRAPRTGSPRLQDVLLPSTLRTGRDVVDLLFEERQRKR